MLKLIVDVSESVLTSAVLQMQICKVRPLKALLLSAERKTKT